MQENQTTHTCRGSARRGIVTCSSLCYEVQVQVQELVSASVLLIHANARDRITTGTDSLATGSGIFQERLLSALCTPNGLPGSCDDRGRKRLS